MNKKIISIALFISSLVILLSSCGKDNYDAPKSNLSGKITYNGESLNLRGTDEKVRLQLYQDGYGKSDPALEVFVGQEGTFSAKLFNGEYKLVTRNGNGPWVNTRDTMIVKVKGTTEIELEVTPFFTISNAAISLDNNTMKTSFTIGQVVASAEMDRVILLLGSTAFVDDGFNVMKKEYTSSLAIGAVNFSFDIDDVTQTSEIEVGQVANAKALFGRVCVWTKGADQGIYSPIVRFR